MSGASETIVPTIAAQTQPPPPIVEVFQFTYRLTISALKHLWTVVAYTISALRSLSVPFTALLLTLYKPLSYLLAPFLLAMNVTFNILVKTPYTVGKQVLSDAYPIYSFMVVTCIYAAFIGLSARVISYVVRSAFAPPSPPGQAVVPGPTFKTAKEPRTKAAKKISIKEEYS